MKKVIGVLLTFLLLGTFALSVFAEPVADDGTFTFETVTSGAGGAFTLIDAEGFSLKVTDAMSYKGLKCLEVTGNGWYNPGGSGNACVLMTGDGANNVMGSELPRGCTITWNLRVPKESSVIEFHTGSSTLDDSGNGVFDACTAEQILLITSKDKGQWKKASYNIPNRVLGDTFLKAVAEEEIDGVVFYIDSVTLTDRNGVVLRSKDIDDTKLGGVADEAPPEHVLSTGITLDRTTMTMEAGQDKQVAVTITPSDTEKKDVLWESSDTAVAMVNNGRITALKVGTCVITAKTVDTGLSVTMTVNVKEAKEKDDNVKDDDGGSSAILYIIIGAGVLILALIIVLIVVLSRNKKKAQSEKDNSGDKSQE